MDMKLELVPVPVTDVDESKDFYVTKMGFVDDHDHVVSEELRFVQLTPPGSACSIVIGLGITEMEPGTQSLQVVVDDVAEVKSELERQRVECSEIDKQPWGWFVYCGDPDGNSWAFQQMVPAG